MKTLNKESIGVCVVSGSQDWGSCDDFVQKFFLKVLKLNYFNILKLSIFKNFKIVNFNFFKKFSEEINPKDITKALFQSEGKKFCNLHLTMLWDIYNLIDFNVI